MSDTTWFWISYVIQSDISGTDIVFGETVTKKHPFEWNMDVDKPGEDTRTNILQWRVITERDAIKFHERIERRNKK
jgi:hypothetical protein